LKIEHECVAGDATGQAALFQPGQHCEGLRKREWAGFRDRAIHQVRPEHVTITSISRQAWAKLRGDGEYPGSA